VKGDAGRDSNLGQPPYSSPAPIIYTLVCRILSLLAEASREELEEHNDVCSICYQDMRLSAKKTNCSHFFHAGCLK
jgi:hypothetical protein